MSRNARIEEVSDSDPESDPSEADIDDLDNSTLIRPADIPTRAPPQPVAPAQRPPQFDAAQREKTKRYQSLYACYFDSSRSRAEGRRIGKNLAVPNPLAREIVDAVSALQLPGQVIFEPSKMHPRDWANPGRVRVLIKENGKLAGRGVVKNKHHLYNLVAEHLRAHPTTEESPNRLRIQGMPLPDKPLPPPAVPRGWKVGKILPLHSPALSGGGVNENMFKDMMAEMQGMGGPQGLAGMLGGGAGAGPGAGGGSDAVARKKEKKKGK